MNGSAELGDVISRLTENPEMMKTLMGVAKNIMGEKPEAADIPAANFKNDRVGDEADRRELDVGCEKGKPFGKKGNDAENLIRLLLALRPFVGSERCAKIDSIVKILKLIAFSCFLVFSL